jgi:hypothetical protein
MRTLEYHTSQYIEEWALAQMGPSDSDQLRLYPDGKYPCSVGLTFVVFDDDTYCTQSVYFPSASGIHVCLPLSDNLLVAAVYILAL